MREATVRDVLTTLALLGLFIVVLVLADCGGSPTEPSGLTVASGDPIKLQPTPTPAGRSPGCIQSAWTDCGNPSPWPTAPPWATPPPGNWPTPNGGK